MKLRDCHLAIGSLIFFALWLFVVLPIYYGPQPHNVASTDQASSQKNNQNLDKGEPMWMPNDSVGLYTLVLAGFTGLLVIVSGFQGWILIRADKTARMTAQAATSSADAAKATVEKMETSIAAAIHSNQIAVTNAEQQLRAYVTAHDIQMLVYRDFGRVGTYNNDVIEGPAQVYSFAVVLRNGGQTPAANIVTNTSCRPISIPLIPDFDFPNSQQFGYGVIGPDSEMHVPVVRVDAPTLEKLDPAYGWYIWGWVEYDDVFEGTVRHRTEFCFEVERVRLPKTGEFLVGFRPHTKFNAVDDQCLRPIDPVTNKSAD